MTTMSSVGAATVPAAPRLSLTHFMWRAVVQYGYVTMFVVAFPLAPGLVRVHTAATAAIACGTESLILRTHGQALANNVLENRIDATKVCMLSRRPEPRGAFDIGTWSDILNIGVRCGRVDAAPVRVLTSVPAACDRAVSYIAVMTNIGITAFETRLMDDWCGLDEACQAYVFIVAEHLVILFKFAVSFFTPDEPESVRNHKLRQDYLVNVLLYGMEEEKDDVDPEEAKSKALAVKDSAIDWFAAGRAACTVRCSRLFVRSGPVFHRPSARPVASFSRCADHWGGQQRQRVADARSASTTTGLRTPVRGRHDWVLQHACGRIRD
jgi:hypothetical protein